MNKKVIGFIAKFVLVFIKLIGAVFVAAIGSFCGYVAAEALEEGIEFPYGIGKIVCESKESEETNNNKETVVLGFRAPKVD